MLQLIAYFVIPVFMILVITYFTIESQRKKDRELKKLQVITRVTSMKSNYKSAVLALVQQQMLTKQGQESVYRIANNFFVFQAVTVENVERCELLLESVINAMPLLSTNKDNLDFAQGAVSLFVRALPTTSSGYSVNFYQQLLPELVLQLQQQQQEEAQQPESINPVSQSAA